MCVDDEQRGVMLGLVEGVIVPGEACLLIMSSSFSRVAVAALTTCLCPAHRRGAVEMDLHLWLMHVDRGACLMFRREPR